MPNTIRQPQKGESGFGMPLRPGLGSPIGPAHRTRRDESQKSLVYEMLYGGTVHATRGLTPVEGAVPADFDYFGKAHSIPQRRRVLEELNRLAALCDGIFRLAKRPMTGSFAEYERVLPSYPTSHVLTGVEPRSKFFAEACMCWRPADADDSADAADDSDDSDCLVPVELFVGKVVPLDAYGACGDVYRLVYEATASARNADSLTRALEERMKTVVFMGGAPESFEQALSALNYYASNSSGPFAPSGPTAATDPVFLQRMEARWVSICSLHSIENQLRARVRIHLQRRAASTVSFLQDAPDDVIAHISRFMDVGMVPNGDPMNRVDVPKLTACMLMQTCRRFAGQEALKLRLPHLRLRSVPGAFPHHRTTSRDRAELSRGTNRAVVRDFVLARKVVRICVDFAVPKRRPAPLKKLERSDGMSNLDHDFSDDEYEAPPEAKSRRGPQPAPNHFPEGTELHGLHIQKEARVRGAWEKLDGPEERVDRFDRMLRVPHYDFFQAPLTLEPELVYADTHEKVESMYTNGLLFSSDLNKTGGLFGQPSKMQFPYDFPAQAKFHVPCLSQENGNRLFKLRITGRGTLVARRGGGAFTQVLLSAPFEVVSKVDVVKVAGRRKTLEEARAAAKRAKK